jgi:hypothetical protein
LCLQEESIKTDHRRVSRMGFVLSCERVEESPGKVTEEKVQGQNEPVKKKETVCTV